MGLTTVLIGQAEIQDVIQPLGNSSLDLMAAGQPPPNPSELLASPAMATLSRRCWRPMTWCYSTARRCYRCRMRHS